jgi:hypothetical protein
MKFNVGDKLRSHGGRWWVEIVGYSNDDLNRSYYMVKSGTSPARREASPVENKTTSIIDSCFKLDYNGVSLMMEVV